jgi:GNAT superfamily N-acetyltransferase
MEIVKIIGGNTAQKRLFHDVLRDVYKGDANFVMPLESDVDAVFDVSKNKRFTKGNAERWLLFDNGQCVGRIAAFFENKNHKILGGWGFFEVLNNVAFAKALIDTAENWLKDQGCEKIQAPVNFGDRDSFWGLLVNGDRKPSYLENYQPHYYQGFIEGLGYEREIEQTTYDITLADFNYERFSAIAKRAKRNSDYRFEFLDFGNLEKYVKDFVQIYNEAWSFHEDFEPLTNEVLLKRFKTMKMAMYPEFAVFAYCKDRPIGFFVSILELNEIFQDFEGRLGLWNKLRFLLRRGSIAKAKGIIFGVVPDYQKMGIDTGLIMKSYEGMMKLKKISSMELAWIGDFNPKMLSMLKSLGAQLTKTHHTYFKKLF